MCRMNFCFYSIIHNPMVSIESRINRNEIFIIHLLKFFLNIDHPTDTQRQTL